MKRKGLLVFLAAVVLAAAGTGAYYGSRYLLIRRIAGWRKDGIAASIAGDHERAADLLVLYLRRRPGDVTALDYYIASREKAELPNGQHLAETIGALKLLLRERPDSLEDRRHLLELYVKIG